MRRKVLRQSKNFSDPIGNRTRGVLSGYVILQPVAPPRGQVGVEAVLRVVERKEVWTWRTRFMRHEKCKLYFSDLLRDMSRNYIDVSKK
jgi:hypothetical protein